MCSVLVCSSAVLIASVGASLFPWNPLLSLSRQSQVLPDPGYEATPCKRKPSFGASLCTLLLRKTLPELIQPVGERVAAVEQFIATTDPAIVHNVVEIADPFGPAITVAELECIVGSEETEAGCQAINSRRREAGMAELAVHLIGVVPAAEVRAGEEDKVSSGTTRRRLLGCRLRPAARRWEGEGPYLVGLTGGSCSGKSSVARRMEGRGWGVVDCDKLGHQAYLPGTPGHAAIVGRWGEQVVAGDGSIDRRWAEVGLLVR